MMPDQPQEPLARVLRESDARIAASGRCCEVTAEHVHSSREAIAASRELLRGVRVLRLGPEGNGEG